MKKYELSLTRNYISDWGVNEAIRELLQNAYDQGDEEIIFGQGTMIIRNYDTNIPESTLALGNTGKKDDDSKVGCYGEGYKLALLVLLRNNYKVSIYNNDKMWQPSFEWSENFNTEILCIQSVDIKGNNNVEFVIEDIEDKVLENIKDEFLGITEESYESIDTVYGEILTDNKYKGKMFVEGLPIMQDSRFKYGYNFKANIVKLDRDRKSINLRELQQICAKSLMSYSGDFEFIDSLLNNNNCDDAIYIKDRKIDFTDDFVDNYCEYLTDKFKVTEKSVIVNKESKEIIKEIEKRQEAGDDIDLITTSISVEADVLNRRNSFSANYINSVHNEVNTRSRYDTAKSDFNYSELYYALEWYKSISSKLTDEEKIKFTENIVRQITPYNFCLIEEEIFEKYGVLNND